MSISLMSSNWADAICTASCTASSRSVLVDTALAHAVAPNAVEEDEDILLACDRVQVDDVDDANDTDDDDDDDDDAKVGFD